MARAEHQGEPAAHAVADHADPSGAAIPWRPARRGRIEVAEVRPLRGRGMDA